MSSLLLRSSTTDIPMICSLPTHSRRIHWTFRLYLKILFTRNSSFCQSRCHAFGLFIAMVLRDESNYKKCLGRHQIPTNYTLRAADVGYVNPIWMSPLKLSVVPRCRVYYEKDALYFTMDDGRMLDYISRQYESDTGLCWGTARFCVSVFLIRASPCLYSYVFLSHSTHGTMFTLWIVTGCH